MGPHDEPPKSPPKTSENGKPGKQDDDKHHDDELPAPDSYPPLVEYDD